MPTETECEGLLDLNTMRTPTRAGWVLGRSAGDRQHRQVGWSLALPVMGWCGISLTLPHVALFQVCSQLVSSELDAQSVRLGCPCASTPRAILGSTERKMVPMRTKEEHLIPRHPHRPWPSPITTRLLGHPSRARGRPRSREAFAGTNMVGIACYRGTGAAPRLAMASGFATGSLRSPWLMAHHLSSSSIGNFAVGHSGTWMPCALRSRRLATPS